ncbi:uncharacterized protein LOC133779924 [Humulus lupulus]|uniref:uncharacterized protein LOC133779924 n=1 Tax=Humulus lupulus TaxID=3486 RepID=UPI002B4135C9|nr:uncharacterized protein LOC133779924 [Humulus lupulus]
MVAEVNNAIPMEQINIMGNFNRQANNPFSNTYNPGWRNHPNFLWRNNQSPRQQFQQLVSQAPLQEMSQPPISQEKTNELQAALLTLTNTQNQFMTETRAFIINLESQVDQLAMVDEKKDKVKEEVNENFEKKQPPVSFEHHIKIPYPQRLQKNKLDKQLSKFLDVFRKLHINIPFAEALEQMQSYVKFMKEISSKKRKLEDYEIVAITEECSVILQKKLPPKLKDSGSFTIPCTIGNVVFEKVLCDLGASVNLMPLSIYRKLKLGEARPTIVTLQMANRSVKHPRGIIDDVLVKVDKLIFPADFIILDMEEDTNIPIILRRPFLATGRALINVQNGELKL